jgi:hypothetical protein
MRLVLIVALLGTACVTVPTEVVGQAEQLAATPGSVWSGAPLGLGEPTIINSRDFVYALAFSPEGTELAFTHHVSTDMELTVTSIAPVTPRFQSKVNSSEFDCEDAVFTRQQVLVVSRQGTLRAFDRTTGTMLREVAIGVPLTRIVLNDSEQQAVVAASNGLVFVFDANTLELLATTRAHGDEVRGLAWMSGAILSAGLDGTIARTVLSPIPPTSARLPSGTRLGRQVFLVHLPDGRGIAAAIDARQQVTTTTRAAARRLKLTLKDDAPTLPILTAEGASTAPAVMVGTLRIQTIEYDDLQAAVCDSCVPPNVELLLGQDVLSKVSFAEDVSAGEMVARLVDGATGARFRAGAATMTTTMGPPLPGPANDLQTANGRLLVTTSAARAERSFDLYDNEKKGIYPAKSPKSGAFLLDPVSLAVVQSFSNQHEGFAVTGALSPDGKTVATGGWDKRIILFDAQTGAVVTERKLSWLLRRLRFNPRGTSLAAAAWTPANPFDDGRSDPALLLYGLNLKDGRAVVPTTPTAIAPAGK